MPQPDFFIVGAPKCGTSALAHFLGQNPAVFLSTPKEPHYFLHPECGIRTIENASHYADIFRRAAKGQMAGEASVWYLYSEHARQAVFRHNPDAKIIIMTREPADFVASLHSQARFDGVETARTIEGAWRRERENVLSSSVASIECLPRWRTMYAELCNFGKYIRRWRETFGDEHVLVLSQEDLQRDARGAYLKAIRFLGVDDDGRTEFDRINSNKVHRSAVVREVLHSVNRSKVITGLSRRVKERLRIGSFGICAALRDFNSRPVPRAPLPGQLRREINVRHQIPSE